MPRTKNFADVIRSRLAANRALANAVRNAGLHAELAQEIYDARIEAGLTQKQLADRVGTQQSVIARMEDADYDGHSLRMLQKIANAVGKEFRAGFHSAPVNRRITAGRASIRRRKKPLRS